LLLAANIVDLIVDDLDEVEFVKGELGIEKLLLHAGDEADDISQQTSLTFFGPL